ncbi:MAG: hypothetical protein HY075_15865 [Deltaproteobacteria bacterium]|nr:hypothetical protein [Deltaproteobacteria bacterium]
MIGLLLLAAAAAAEPTCGGLAPLDVLLGEAKSPRKVCKEPGGALLSPECVGTGASGCLALKAAEKARSVKLPPTNGGSNPSAVACSLVGGKVVLGRETGGDERCFCSFSDHSLLSCGGLFTYRGSGGS